MDFVDNFYAPIGLSYSGLTLGQNINLYDVVKVFFLDVRNMNLQLTLSKADHSV